MVAEGQTGPALLIIRVICCEVLICSAMAPMSPCKPLAPMMASPTLTAFAGFASFQALTRPS